MLDPRLVQLAQNIRNAILDSDFSAAEVARSLQVDRSAVARWMTGERTPTMDNLVKLADLLDREVDEFWRGPEAIPATKEQRLVLEHMRSMPPEQQAALLAYIAATAPLRTP